MYHLTILWLAIAAAAYVVGRIHGSRPKLTEDDLLNLQERGMDAAHNGASSDEERRDGSALWRAASAALGRRGETRAERAAGLTVCRAARKAVR